MESNNGTIELVEKAFSSYVRACIQHAQKDYFVKQSRDSKHVIPLDAVTFELNINVFFRPYDIPQTDNNSIFPLLLEQLQLSQKEKKVIYYKYYEDKTDKEIARHLGISRQAVGKIKAQVLVKLKRHMEL